MRKSADQGASLGPPVTIAKLRATGINGDLGLNPGFRTSSFPQAAASPSNAGHLFIVYNDQTGSGATLDRGDIYFARSSDGGSSWSAPVKVNDDATRRDQWQPSLALSLDGKRLCLAWYDRRLDPLNNLIDRFGVIGRITTSGAVTFDNNFRITNEAFPPVVGVDPMVNALYMGDYDQMASNDVHFGTTWGDNRDNSTGHAGKNANVRFAKILAAGAAGGSPSGEGSNEIAVSELPEFAVSAIRRAIDEAPAETVAKPVVWEKAFEMAETIAMYQLKGKDAKGRILEVETKGIRVIEIEVKLPTTNVPEALIASAKKLSPDFHPRQWTAVIVAGKIVNYEVLGSSMSDESTPLNFTHGIGEPREVKVEATFTSEGKLSGRRIRD